MFEELRVAKKAILRKPYSVGYTIQLSFGKLVYARK